jgi:RES domain-containing protein
VSECDLVRLSPPNYLFTSGYPGRYNSDGVLALYASEDAATAGEEWERRARQLPRLPRQLVYFVEFSVPILDLGNAATLEALELTQADLTAPWEFVLAATMTQRLGDAVAAQQRFGGIRFASDAARLRGFVGFNIVLFRTAIAAPNFVVVRQDDRREIQRWP